VRVEILGSGGAVPIPRPGCGCRVCVQARQRGLPYARTGPSVFVHGPDLLFDTPEESRLQLDRAGIGRIAGCFYSHWHPDHVMGRRVFETRNMDWRSWPRPELEATPVYLPEQVAADARTYLGTWDHLAFLEHVGVVRLHELRDGETVELDGVVVTPFRLAEDYVYAFLLEGDGRRVLLCMDELNGWTPPELGRLDLAVLPMGVLELDPRTGERLIPADNPVLEAEATFAETLEIVRRLDAARVVLSHVEEMDTVSHDDLREIGEREGVEFAHDTMQLPVDAVGFPQ